MRDVSTGGPLDPITAIVAAPPPSMLPRVIRMVGRSLAVVGSLMLKTRLATFSTSGAGSLLMGPHKVCPRVSFFCWTQRVARSRQAHDEAGQAGGHVRPVAPSR